MHLFLNSIVQQNNYEPDNKRFNNLMILYEKNKIEKRLKPKKVYVNFIIELKELNGKSVFGDDVEVESVLTL